MNLTCVAFGALFILFGLAVALGLVHKHLSGWKNTPEEEKAKIRIGPLCRNIGLMIGLAGVIIFVSGLDESFREHYFVWLMIVWLIIGFVDVWRIDRKDLYKVNRKPR